MRRADPTARSSEELFADSLQALAVLVPGSLRLTDLLTQVAALAARAIPGADGAGVTSLVPDGGTGTRPVLAASHPFVAELDHLQHSAVHEGPCLTATRERRTVRSGSLGGERMWPRFGPRAGRIGVHSAMSVPLVLSVTAVGTARRTLDGTARRTLDGTVPGASGSLDGSVVGAVTVYARATCAFDGDAPRVGELFAAPAAVVMHNARSLARAEELAAQLQRSLATRPVVDQAIGILRSRTGGSAQEAFDLLRAISQREQTKLADVARRLVDEAVRRARSRHAQEPEHPIG